MKDMKKIFAIGVLLIFIFAFSAAAFAADAEDGVITLTPADLVNGASGEGWFFDGNLNIESGYTLVFDGECWYPVHNHGIIKDGTFVDEVNNHGTIEDGTFNGPVFNYGTIASGNFNGLLSNDAGIIEDGSFVEKVTNYGTIKGGTFSGEVINEGVIGGGTFDNEVFNRGGGNIIGGTFTKQVTNDCTIEGGKFDCNVKNSRGGAIAGGSFGEGFSVENDGDIRGGNFDGSVINNQNAVILTGVFTGNLVNHGKIEGGNFNSGVANNYEGIISGGVFTGGLSNYGIVTGTADLSKLYSFDNYSDRYGKDVKLQKAVIRGDITYVGCEPVEITLNYFADDVQTAEWKVSGEFYSYEVEKWRRSDPEAELSGIVGIEHRVEATAIDGYNIIIENPVWDRFDVTVTKKEHAHVWSEEWAGNHWFHWYNCTADGCDLPVDMGEGKEGFDWHLIEKPKSDGGSGMYHKGTCSVCGYTESVDFCEYTLERHNDTHHWSECICGAKKNVTAHSGGTATCTEKAVCEVCAMEYGEVDPDNHADYGKVTKKAVKETCTKDGYTGDMHCKGCNNLLERGTVTLAHGHDYGRWITTEEATENEGGKQVKICRICGNKTIRYTKPLSEDGIEIIYYYDKDEETNPNTGAPVFVPAIVGFIFAAAAIGKRR